jgi:hypothetical protein
MYHKKPELYYIRTLEDLEVLRRHGIEVSVETLVKIKEQLQKDINLVQEEIDVWTLNKLEANGG